MPGLSPTLLPALRVAPLMALALTLCACDRTTPQTGESLTRGILQEVSPLPDPKASPYPDCLQIVRVEILSSTHAGEAGANILVAWPGFLERQATPMADLKVGDVVTMQLAPFTEAPATMQARQRADAIDAFDLDLFFTAEARRVATSDRASSETDPPRALPDPPFEVDTPRVETGRVPDRRRDDLAAEKTRIEQALASNGGSWDQWSQALHPFLAELWQAAREGEGYLRTGNHFYERTYNHRYDELMKDPEASPPLRMLVALDRELAKKGVDLIVTPFPFKEEINGGQFSDQAPADGHYAPNRLRMLHWLLDHDVEVLDLAPALQENLHAEWLYYDYGELHPARDGISVAARAIARRLERYELPSTLPALATAPVTFAMPDPFRKRFPFMPDPAIYPASQVTDQEGPFLAEAAERSPVLLIGDSFTRVPSLYGVREASLREHLALETGILPKTVRVRGSASQMMRILGREPKDLFEGVEVCIFVFAQYPLFSQGTDEGGDWEIIPFAPRTAPLKEPE